ncbi:MAG: hypothetical protein Q8909_20425, partial [Bacteroidota bacterium]|nr:hypothetical protein [Bacteroidota bacterium]
SKVYLSAKEQVALAKTYQRQDSLLADALKRGAAFSEIEAIENEPIISRYDSLVKISDFQVRSIAYINNKIGMMDQIKPLTDGQKKQISALFLPKCDASGCVYADILKQTLPQVVSDTAYYAGLFASEIHQKALDATDKYPRNRTLSPYILTIPQAKRLIYQYQKAVIAAGYAYHDKLDERDKLVSDIDIYYLPIIDSVLVSRGFISLNSQFSLAIQQRKFLKLSVDQIQKLTEKNAEIQKLRREYSLKNPGKECDSNGFYRQHIPGILNENQYRTMLQLWHQNEADYSCADTWAEMKRLGVANVSDSASVNRSLYSYYINKLVIEDIYANKSEVRSQKLWENDFFKPESLKTLEQAIQNEKAKSASQSGSNASFVW